MTTTPDTERWDYEDDRPRCELDTVDGRVCQAVLRPGGSCPRAAAHPAYEGEGWSSGYADAHELVEVETEHGPEFWMNRADGGAR